MHNIPHSKKTRKLISLKLKGHSYLTPFSRKKISIAMKNRIISKETRKKLSIINTGKHATIKTKQKISNSIKKFNRTNRGRKIIKIRLQSLKRLDVRKKMSLARKGRSYEQIYGIKEASRQKRLRSRQFSEFPIAKRNEISKKISQGTKESFTSERRKEYSRVFKGKNNPNWQGGKSLEEYTVDWTSTLRCAVRERDKYRCQDCGEPQKDYAFDVHHKDTNKKNCELSNLITLCRSCHRHRHRIGMRLKCAK